MISKKPGKGSFFIITNTFLVNTARRQLVDEYALYYCLKNGKIAGAALDLAGVNEI